MPDTAQTSARLRLAALGSIAVALAVLGLKFLAYWRTGSVALYSDALESIVNLVTAVAALYAMHIPTSRPTGSTSSAITRPSTSPPCSRAC